MEGKDIQVAVLAEAVQIFRWQFYHGRADIQVAVFAEDVQIFRWQF